MPGRITIAKTFLISQVNYLGSVFMPTSRQIEKMQLMMDAFIKKNLSISDDRVELPPSAGGLGFFNIKNS
jgi:hypothetical protein